MNNLNTVSALYLTAAFLALIAAIIGKNYVFLMVGCSFGILGLTLNRKSK